MTPTPAPGNDIQVGRWTLTSAGTVGIGGSGRVSVGVGHTGEVVALKRMSIASAAVPNNAASLLKRRQRTLETLTQLTDAAKKDHTERLLEVITDDPQAANVSADVCPGMIRTMTISLLEAIDFLHSHDWIHGDIKPMNIGVRLWDFDQASIVLLDIEDAIYAPDGYTLPKPGTTGTIGWLSPERELDTFTATVDVWAAGVVAIWMLLGRHPWQFRQNPWRYGDENKKQRPLFHAAYDTVTQNFVAGEDIGEPKPLILWSTEINLGEIGDIGKAILQMVRHPYAHTDEQRKTRPSCREIIQILSVGGQKVELPDGPSQKRIRV
ncbi:hypothetical protein CEP54_015932 [Fusarium duplospermum]|uniref:Protein kinase domain-containing protein n=1 Tax=Fusarium duplospermum TaxID=1325734 RepID=A0A428NJS4_9HYPO|nr:hypothetical protein CEP54_015932 [Fusarium duplospermum]